MIAGYHWFTDWGRDTMISLEGLTLTTGRHAEAGYILRTFAHYVRDGLIPNMFPEGEREGLYHTADATLWFFHAVDRYLARHRRPARRCGSCCPSCSTSCATTSRAPASASASTRRTACSARAPRATSSPGWTPRSDDWVVTPRRGKAVEINALWYNALLPARGLAARGARRRRRPSRSPTSASAARESFNRRFWYAEGGYLYDVVDGEDGDDPACRPNQVLAISLDHPVLDRERWEPVLDVVRARLLTPVGLRSLAPGPSRLQAALLRRPPRPRRGLSSGDGVGLAHRAVRSTPGSRHIPDDRAAARSLARRARHRTWASSASAPSARSSTPSRRTRHGAASPRPGAWRKCSAAG